MNWKIKAGIAILVLGGLVGRALLVHKARSHSEVIVTLRIAVTPGDQVDFVAGRGNSAQFKYLVGKQSGVKPVLAQKLSVKPVPHSSSNSPTTRIARKQMQIARRPPLIVPNLSLVLCKLMRVFPLL